MNWREGNRVRLLENGETFFPRVFEAIAQSRREVLIETFLLFDDPIGQGLREAVIAAARRGVRVELTVDGHGCAFLPKEFIESMAAAGVRFHLFDPRPTVFGVRTNPFRRLHRKIVVIDAQRAFVGGINFGFDHVRESGATSKQDYAVEIEGPLVADIHAVANAMAGPVPGDGPRRWWRRWRPQIAPTAALATAGDVQAAFVIRDNGRHRTDIERAYRDAIRSARHDVLLANAYFFPGYRLLRDLREAAKRGVRVRLLLQGYPDMPLVKRFEGTLYDYLLRGGVEIHEYCERPLHGKIAVIDDDWATVGSSNLDPPSLALNLEANVIVRDREFNRVLRGNLERLLARHCKPVSRGQLPPHSLWQLLLQPVVFHFLRNFPQWAGALPMRAPQRAVIGPGRPEMDRESPRRKEAA